MARGKGLRKYTKGRGSTWKKGQSSSSNPECTRHRDAAKAGHAAPSSKASSKSVGSNTVASAHTRMRSRCNSSVFMDQNDDMKSLVSGIRSLADTFPTEIRRYRATESFSSDVAMNDKEDKESAASDGLTNAQTIRSHVSDWTRCTNPTFDRFLEYWSTDSALHREMLSVLASATELIAEREKSRSAGESGVARPQSSNNTEYFVIFLASSANSSTPETTVACFCLASMLADKLPETIRRSKFSDISKQVLSKLHAENNSDIQQSPLFLISCIKILSALLRCQDEFTWNQPSTVQVFDTILHLLVHAKPKVRKAATHATALILRDASSRTSSKSSAPEHPTTLRTVTYIREKLNDYLVTNNESSLLQLLGIVQQVVPYFPSNSVRPLIEFCLRLLGHGQVLLALVALKTLRSLFPRPQKESTELEVEKVSKVDGKSSLTYETAAQLLNALYEHQPNAVKVSLISKWLGLQSSIILFLVQTRSADGIKHVPHFVRNCAASIWQLQQQVPAESHEAVASSLMKLFRCMPKIPADNNLGFAAVIKNISDTLQQCFTFPYHMTWKPVTLVCGALFTMLKDETDEAVIILMAPLLQCVADIRQQPQCSCISEIDHALSAGVKALGPAFVLQALPLKYNNAGDPSAIAAPDTLLTFEGTWIIPIIYKSLTTHPLVDKSKVKLANFLQEFIPLLRSTDHAIKCMKSSTVFHTDSYYDNLRACQSIESQSWSLFAAYCRYASDLSSQFPHIAQRFGEIIQAAQHQADSQTASELQKQVFAVLRCSVQNMLDSSDDNSVVQHNNIMSQYAKNYLPRLCSIYTEFKMSTDKCRLPALETFKLYLRVAPRELASSMLQDILNNKLLGDISILQPKAPLEKSASNWMQKNEKFSALLDLVIALVPHAAVASGDAMNSNSDTVAKANAKALVGLVVALLNSKQVDIAASVADDAGRFKKACRLMEELFRCNCANLRQLKTAVLSACPKSKLSTTSAAAASANKAPWLRCVRHLLIHSAVANAPFEFDAELVKKLLPTVVMSRNDLNVKTRAAADAVTLTMVEQYVMQANEDGVPESGNIVRLLINTGTKIAARTSQADLLEEFIDYLLQKFFSYPSATPGTKSSERAKELVEQSRATLQLIVSIISRFKSIMPLSTISKLVTFLCATLQTAQSGVRAEQKELMKLQARREAEVKRIKDARNKMLPPAAVEEKKVVKRGIHRANPIGMGAQATESEKDAEIDDEEAESSTATSDVAVVHSTAPTAELSQFYNVMQSVLQVFDAVVTKVPYFGEHVMNMVTLLYGTNNLLSISTRQHFHRKLSELTTRMLRKYDYTMLQEIWPEEQRKLLSAPRKRERKQVAKKVAAEKDEKNSKRKKIGKKQRAHEGLLKGNATKLLLGGESDVRAMEEDSDADDDEEEEESAPIFEDEEFRARSARRNVSQKLRESSNQIIDFLEPQTMLKRLY